MRFYIFMSMVIKQSYKVQKTPSEIHSNNLMWNKVISGYRKEKTRGYLYHMNDKARDARLRSFDNFNNNNERNNKWER